MATCRRQLGLLDDGQWQRFQAKQGRIAAERERLESLRVQPDSAIARAFAAESEQNVASVRSACACALRSLAV